MSEFRRLIFSTRAKALAFRDRCPESALRVLGLLSLAEHSKDAAESTKCLQRAVGIATNVSEALAKR